jgi:hypothetical protein
MSSIPTAKEFFEQGGEYPDLAIAFAKLHVQAALKAALESIPCLGSSTDIASYDEIEKEVLNAYPENLIQ